MAAARCFAAILLVACGTPRPYGALVPGDDVALVVKSSSPGELAVRPVSSAEQAHYGTEFAVGCLEGAAEVLVLLPVMVVGCAVGAVGVDMVTEVATRKPSFGDPVLSELIADEVAKRDFAVRFQESLDAQAATQFRVVSSKTLADGVLHARLSGIEVAIYANGQFALRVDGSTRVERPGQRGPTVWNRIVVETPKRAYKQWTASDGELLIGDIDAGLGALAQAMLIAAMKDARAH